MPAEFDKLEPIGEIQLNPSESQTTDTKFVLQSLQQLRVAKCVKRCRDIKRYEDCQLFCFDVAQYVIENFE